MLMNFRFKHPKLDQHLLYFEMIWGFRKAIIADIKAVAREYKEEWKESRANERTHTPR